jgi:hypothetical protein
MEKIFFLLIMLTSVAHAEVFKCLLVSDKVVYQAAPCQSDVKQEIVEIKKSDPQKVADAEANLKIWEEGFAKREAVRKKVEEEHQAELYRQWLHSNMPIQYHPYYSSHPFYRSHHWHHINRRINRRNFHKH